MIPTKSQWGKWSLPSKLTAIGTLISILSFSAFLIEKTYGLSSTFIKNKTQNNTFNQKQVSKSVFYSPLLFLEYLVDLVNKNKYQEISELVYPFMVQRMYSADMIVTTLKDNRELENIKEIIKNYRKYDVFSSDKGKIRLLNEVVSGHIQDLHPNKILTNGNYDLITVGIKGTFGGHISFIKDHSGVLTIIQIKETKDIVRMR